jgi:hypothetical protein
LHYDADTFNDNGNIITCEEHDFSINAMLHNIKTYHLRNVLLYELGRNVSTWIDIDSNRNVNYAKQVINDKYNLKLYIFPDDTAKTFNYIGHALEPNSKIRKIRFAVDRDDRINACQASGRTDIQFYELPTPMSAADALEYCMSNNLYGIKEVHDTFYKNKSPLLKAHTKKSVQFNWDVLPEFRNIKKIITIQKFGIPEKITNFFDF